ncbi:MAG TPA: glycosyltransferase family 4 protein [Ktedonosporobacter sp.]|nr:glycosyltransferase family 4 protein [Ktedonosporobacter sp.]
MRRLNILIWHIHGSYLNTLARIDHNWFLPVKPGRPEGYGGRGPTFDLPDYVREVPAEAVRYLPLDLIIYQTPKNYFEDQYEILSDEQRRLPKIYLEHNTPKPHPTDTRHPVDDPAVLLVHVTHYNRLMWDNGSTPTIVIEHSVAIDPTASYTGRLERGITIINGMQQRPRIAGYDLFLKTRELVPLDAVGMGTEALDGLGDVPYRELHRRIADYRFLFSPIRYTSLPLAVIEAMTMGMPVVALATTELPTVIEHGRSGYVSCDMDALIECMCYLLAYPEEAKRLGENARVVARERFGLERFIRDWNAAFALVREEKL